MGTARPVSETSGQKLFDTTANAIPASAITLATDHTTTCSQRGTAVCCTLLMPAV